MSPVSLLCPCCVPSCWPAPATMTRCACTARTMTTGCAVPPWRVTRPPCGQWPGSARASASCPAAMTAPCACGSAPSRDRDTVRDGDRQRGKGPGTEGGDRVKKWERERGEGEGKREGEGMKEQKGKWEERGEGSALMSPLSPVPRQWHGAQLEMRVHPVRVPRAQHLRCGLVSVGTWGQQGHGDTSLRPCDPPGATSLGPCPLQVSLVSPDPWLSPGVPCPP